MDTCKFSTLRKHSAGDKYAPVKVGNAYQLINASGERLIGNRGKVYEFATIENASTFMSTNLARLANAIKATNDSYILNLGNNYIELGEAFILKEIQDIDDLERGLWRPVIEVNQNQAQEIEKKTTIEWNNIVIPAYKIVLDTTENKYKLGNGINRFKSLSYINQVILDGFNAALSINGAVAQASSTYSDSAGYAIKHAINGDRTGRGWGVSGGWNDAGQNFPWVIVTFKEAYSINRINVFSLQDNYNNPIEPTKTMTFTGYGLVNFKVQYWAGNNWVDIPNASVTNNNKVWVEFNFERITTQKIRLQIDFALGGYSRLVEIEAWDLDN